MKTLAIGGAERALVTLANEFCRLGVKVDLVVTKRSGLLLPEVSKDVRILGLGKGSSFRAWLLLVTQRLIDWQYLPSIARTGIPSIVRRLPTLRDYFASERPVSVLASTPANSLTTLWARSLSPYKPRVIIREASTLSINAQAGSTAFERLAPEFGRRWYPEADGIVCVSAGVGDDLSNVTGLPRDRIALIYSAVEVERVRELAAQSPEDPWLTDAGPPVLVTVGGLHKAKDQATLIYAFAKVLAAKPCRLIIVGEGSLRPKLEALTAALGVDAFVKFAGARANPFNYMSHAKMFILSSAWEGLPNVLLEALACGCQIVSTDCQSGPSEILAQGRYGSLVPVGDVDALASAILENMDSPPVPEGALVDRARQFSPEEVARKYLKLLLQE